MVDHAAGSVVERVRTLHPEGIDALVKAGFAPADIPKGALRPASGRGTIAKDVPLRPDVWSNPDVDRPDRSCSA